VETNVPGVIARLVAPVVAQLSVLLVPEVMLAGTAVKEEMVGTAPVPEDALEEVVEPQPANPTQASKRASAPRFRPKELRFGELRRFRQNEPVEPMRNPKQTQSIAPAVTAVALYGLSPMDLLASAR
jgi:hypothetical protein